jgi:predicted transglutaminase-like cysteine proteinase
MLVLGATPGVLAGSGRIDTSVQKTGGRTSQPIGHYEYCLANLKDCNIRSLFTQPVKLTRKKWEQMVEANYTANATIEPVTDFDFYGVEEFWTLPKTKGDCEDFVLMKRNQLMRQGWPASSLLATVVLQPNGEGHAVLTVRTSKGDFILDNLRDEILAWDKTEYRYLKRQAANHSGHWEDILDTRLSVASITRQ